MKKPLEDRADRHYSSFSKGSSVSTQVESARCWAHRGASGASQSLRNGEPSQQAPNSKTPSAKEAPGYSLKNRPARRLLRHRFPRFGVCDLDLHRRLGFWCLVFRCFVQRRLKADGGIVIAS